MWKNYIKIAIRNIRKNLLYSFVNILGLTIGLACCLLIGLYIHHELSYDSFHEKSDQIVRATMEYKSADKINPVATTGTKVGPELKRSFPEVEDYVRTFIGKGTIKKDGQAFSEDKILFADPNLFQVFSFELISGDPKTALDAPDKVVLTESMAKKYFGNESPINKTLNIRGKEMRITGVCKDVPKNSQIKFDFATQFFNIGSGVKEEQWWTANWITYLELQKGQNVAALQKKVNAYMDYEAVRQQTGLERPNFLHFNLQPLRRVHLHSDLAGFEPNGSFTFISILVVVSLLILLIASANYTNLATAQSGSRSAEIGMRKVMGANGKQIFTQFMSETLVITIFSALLALGVALLAIPYFSHITGVVFERRELLQRLPLGLLFGITLLVSFLAGLNPALILSRGRAINILSKGFNSTGGKALLRKSLIVGQFAISIFLIIYTMVIVQQTNFINDKDLGYNKDHVLVLPINAEIQSNFDSFKAALLQIKGVTGVTASYETPEFVNWGDGITAFTKNGKKDISLKAMPVDLDLVKTMEMKLLAGRDFRKSDFGLMDTTNNMANYRQPYIINESLARQIGWTPGEAIGKTIEKNVPGPVVGVVKDFNFSSLHEPVGPLVMFLGRNLSRIFMIRTAEANLDDTLADIEALFKARTTGAAYEAHFLDEDYEALYKTEQRSLHLFKMASGIAIFLACLGLFSLSAFTSQKRTKEIGIRKTLGATVGNLVFLLGKNLLYLVFISSLIAIPLAFWASKTWLAGFSYKIDLGIDIFLFGTFITIFITAMVVGFQTFRAALQNPVKNLKTE